MLPTSTTNFVSDSANVAVSAVQLDYDLGPIMNSGLTTYQQQDIKEFLKKPVVIATGTFGIADTGILSNLDAYNLFLRSEVVQSKIKGHLAIRGKLIVRIVFNGNRFQQGRYFMAFFNTAGSSNTAPQAAAWFNLHVATLTQRTQLPKVEFDINRDSEAVLEVPWMSTYSHMLVSSNVVTFTKPGNILLCAYSPLVAPTGSTTAPYTIYAHMENVEIETPTAPQSKVRFKSKNPQDNEQQQGNIGPISSTLTKISKSADILGQIPLLSSITGPVSWFTDILASAANVFGWSNPLDLSEVTRAVQTIVPFANNSDMPDGSMPLALTARNQLEVLPGLGATDIDESSLDHIKSIPAYFAAFNFTTSNTVNQAIYDLPVIYGSFSTTITDNARSVVGFTPISFLCQYFNMVRGSIILKFKIVNTEFHSGRLAVVYTPSDPTNAVNVTSTTQPYVHREIIDLREGNEFDYVIPYTSVRPYVTPDLTVGYLRVFVVNPLVAPSSVSTTVRVLVEVAGGPDFEYAAPTTNGYRLNFPSAPQSNVSFVPSINAIKQGDLGNSQICSHNNEPARYCVGERVMSIYSLLKHNNEIIPTVQGTTASSALIAPFAIHAAGFVVAVVDDNLYRSDMYAQLVSCFAMSRGAVRLRIFNNAATSVNSQEFTTATVRYLSSTINSGIQEFSTPRSATQLDLRVIQNSLFRGCIEVQTPPYHFTYARCNQDELVGNSAVVKASTSSSANTMVISVNTATANGNRYWRQVADDFQVAGFISTPCMWVG